MAKNSVMQSDVYGRDVRDKKNASDSFAARYPDKEPDDMPKAAMQRPAHYVCLADEIAQSKQYFRNYLWPDAKKHYPLDIQVDSRMVTRFYPYAKGGPLYVDEPRSKAEATICFEKQRHMQAKGLRHVVIEPDTDMIAALDQLKPKEKIK